MIQNFCLVGLTVSLLNAALVWWGKYLVFSVVIGDIFEHGGHSSLHLGLHIHIKLKRARALLGEYSFQGKTNSLSSLSREQRALAGERIQSAPYLQAFICMRLIRKCIIKSKLSFELEQINMLTYTLELQWWAWAATVTIEHFCLSLGGFWANLNSIRNFSFRAIKCAIQIWMTSSFRGL